MFKNLLVPFLFALAVAHTACADPGMNYTAARAYYTSLQDCYDCTVPGCKEALGGCPHYLCHECNTNASVCRPFPEYIWICDEIFDATDTTTKSGAAYSVSSTALVALSVMACMLLVAE